LGSKGLILILVGTIPLLIGVFFVLSGMNHASLVEFNEQFDDLLVGFVLAATGFGLIVFGIWDLLS